MDSSLLSLSAVLILGVTTYVYLLNNRQERRPRAEEITFAPGEFEKWASVRESALETIDLTFTEGIDWQAFFASFQELRQQYPDQNIAVQGMEEKGDAFVVRLKVKAEATGPELEQLKGEIETSQKQLYSTQLALSAAEGKIEVYQEMMGVVKKLADKPMGEQNFYGTVGNVAGTNWGQMTATINQNYGTKADEIVQLLTTLRESTQSFPDEDKETALACVEDLTNDLAQPQPNRAKLKTRFIALLGVAIALGGAVATATDFTNNVLELSEKLDVPTQTLEPHLQQLKQLHPDFQWHPAE